MEFTQKDIHNAAVLHSMSTKYWRSAGVMTIDEAKSTLDNPNTYWRCNGANESWLIVGRELPGLVYKYGESLEPICDSLIKATEHLGFVYTRDQYMEAISIHVENWNAYRKDV